MVVPITILFRVLTFEFIYLYIFIGFLPFIIGTSRKILYKIRLKCNCYKSVKLVFALFYIAKKRVKKSSI